MIRKLLCQLPKERWPIERTTASTFAGHYQRRVVRSVEDLNLLRRKQRRLSCSSEGTRHLHQSAPATSKIESTMSSPHSRHKQGIKAVSSKVFRKRRLRTEHARRIDGTCRTSVGIGNKMRGASQHAFLGECCPRSCSPRSTRGGWSLDSFSSPDFQSARQKLEQCGPQSNEEPTFRLFPRCGNPSQR